MSVMPSSTVVGVFRDRSAAELAMQALHNAGFRQEQMRCLVTGTSGNFFEDLKSFFTGVSPDEKNLVNNLTEMGLSDTETQYFSDEYAMGSAILAVKTQGDEQMALNILDQYGVHNAKRSMSFPDQPGGYGYLPPSGQGVQTQAPETPRFEDHQPTEGHIPSRHARHMQPPPFDYNLAPYQVQSSIGALMDPLPENVFSNGLAPFPAEAASNSAAPVPEEVVSDKETTFSEDATWAPVEQVSEVSQGAEEVDEVETPIYRGHQLDTSTPEINEVKEIETPAIQNDQVRVTPPEAEETPRAPGYQTSEGVPAQDTHQAYTAGDATEHKDELQRLLGQVQTTRQQLQEARARLEAVKARESQLTTARLQLKELQAELQATQAELRETEQRMLIS